MKKSQKENPVKGQGLSSNAISAGELSQELSLEIVRKRIVILIFSLSFLLYGNTLWNGYSMDDELVSKDNQLVAKGLAGIPNIFTSRYSVNEKQNYEYRPIVLTTFAIEYELVGQSPALSHFVNVLLYALVGVVLFFLLLRMFKNAHWALPAVTVIIFMVHPLHTEVVASIKNRDEILSLLFSLLSLRSFLKLTDGEGKINAFYGIIFMILSLLSKLSSLPMVAIIPFSIWFFGKPSRFKMIFTIIGLLFAYKIMRAMYIVLASNTSEKRQLLYLENPLYNEGYGLVDRIPVAIETIGFYFQKFIFPHPLSAYYGFNTFSLAGWGDPSVWIFLLIISILIYFGISGLKTRTPLSFGVFYFFLSISMFSNLVVPAVGIVAERFVFAASVGMCLITASLILKVTSIDLKGKSFIISGNKMVLYLTGIVLLLFSFKTIDRNRDWNSAASLYKADVGSFPNSAKLNSLMASVYVEQLNRNRMGLLPLTNEQKVVKMDSAIYFFRQALTVYPDYIAVNNNIGTLYFNQKEDIDSARKYFGRAVYLDSSYSQAYFNLASIYEFDQELYSLMNRMLTRVTEIPDSLVKEGLLTEVPMVISEFSAIRLVERNLVFSVNDLLASRSKEDLEAKTKRLPQLVKDNFAYYFRGLPFVPNSDSLAVELFRNVKRFLSNEVSGQPAQVVRFSVVKSCGPQYVDFLQKISKGKTDLPNWVYFARSRFESSKDSMIICLNKALEYQSNLGTAFEKLNSAYQQFQMHDSIISLNTRMMSHPTYQKEQLLINMGNAEFAKGNIEQGIKDYIQAASLDEVILFRLGMISQQLATARNNGSLQIVNQWYLQKKKELYLVYQLISNKYSEMGDATESSRYSQLSAKYQ